MNSLRLGIIVDGLDDASIGVRKLLEAVSRDERYHLSHIFVCAGGEHAKRSIYGAAMGLEAMLFARARAKASPVLKEISNALEIRHLREARLPPDIGALDVIINVSSAAPAAAGDNIRFGIWRLTSFAPVAGFWETYRAAPVTTVDLVRYAADAPPQVIASAAYNTKFIASRNAAFVQEKSIQLVMRELARLHLTGSVSEGSPAPAPLRAPDFGRLLLYEVKFGAALLKRALRILLAKLRFRPGMWTLQTGRGDVFNYDPKQGKTITPCGNRYWADPFLISREGETFVFFEDYDYKTKLGRISVGKIDFEKFEYIGPALKTDYHLSFPFVFAAQEDILMIPETNQTKRIEIWRCDEFPFKWSLHKVILEGVTAADSVIAEYRGEWWLFTNITNDSYGDHCSELHLFRLSGLDFKTVTPHPLNPVVIDSRMARNGGRVFTNDGKLYRIAQNNSGGEYGYGLNVMEINRLDMEGYEEQIVRSIDPSFDASLMGCHHLDALDGVCVMDVRRKIGGFSA